MSFYRTPPAWLRSFFPGLIWARPGESKIIYLSFDDGPDEEITPRVLDLLAKYDAKATFFCLGRQAEINPGIFERITREGHAVGNHSYSHPDGWKTSTRKYIEDVDLADRIIGGNLFRPPYGRLRWAQASALKKKYKIVMWSRMLMDFRESETEKITGVHNFNAGDILVLHDNKNSDRYVGNHLPALLEWLGANGFIFGKIK